MKVTTFNTLVFGLFVTAAFSCKKSSDTPAKTKTDLLTQKTWVIQDAAVDANANGAIDAGESIKTNAQFACRADNSMTFKADHTSTMDEGTTKCTASDPQSANYTWHFDATESNITSDDPLITSISSGTAKILLLDENTLKLSTSGSLFGVPVTYLLVLQHQ